MKTQAMDKAKTAVSECLYPFKSQLGTGYPTSRQFEVVHGEKSTGAGIKARVAFDGRVCIAKISGYALSERRRYTLQLSSRIHLYDSWFSGRLSHSCQPNVFLDLQYLELWTLHRIAAGDWLTVDHASVEEQLFRQFECTCGAPNCRRWITGSNEHLNAEGLAFMAKGCNLQRP